MKHRIITISREFGSGGRTIGKMTAKELNIPCYDKELIQQIAEESGFAESYVRDTEETAPKGFFNSALSPRAFGPTQVKPGIAPGFIVTVYSSGFVPSVFFSNVFPSGPDYI